MPINVAAPQQEPRDREQLPFSTLPGPRKISDLAKIRQAPPRLAHTHNPALAAIGEALAEGLSTERPSTYSGHETHNVTVLTTDPNGLPMCPPLVSPITQRNIRPGGSERAQALQSIFGAFMATPDEPVAADSSIVVSSPALEDVSALRTGWASVASSPPSRRSPI